MQAGRNTTDVCCGVEDPSITSAVDYSRNTCGTSNCNTQTLQYVRFYTRYNTLNATQHTTPHHTTPHHKTHLTTNTQLIQLSHSPVQSRTSSAVGGHVPEQHYEDAVLI